MWALWFLESPTMKKNNLIERGGEGKSSPVPQLVFKILFPSNYWLSQLALANDLSPSTKLTKIINPCKLHCPNFLGHSKKISYITENGANFFFFYCDCKLICSINNINFEHTSYVTVPPDVAVWQSVTLDMAPLADKMQTALGPFWGKDIIFNNTSCGDKF